MLFLSDFCDQNICNMKCTFSMDNFSHIHIYCQLDYSMESGEGQIIRIQICQKCYQHQSYDCHSEQQYHEAYQKFSLSLKQTGFSILRNVAPKYLKKAPNNKNSTKRYIDSNTGKIVQFPGKGTFQVYYRNILIFSKLQVSTFPDIPYLCLILKNLKNMYQANPQKFRDIQFQWKKNQATNQSLYTFIKMNSLGNTEQTFIKDIISKLIVEGTQQQTKKNKKKIVHPYSIYENAEKKQKMQSIYCPKSMIPQYLTQRGGNGLFSTRNFKRKQLRPQTSQISTKKNKQCDSNSWTQRQYGTIVKNMKKNHIFQLVIKEQSKQLDKEKIKRILRNENLSISKGVFEKDNNKNNPNNISNKNFRFHSNTKQNRTERQKRFQKSKSKQVYITHLQNLKQKQIKKNGNIISLNFKSDQQRKRNCNQDIIDSKQSSITDRLKIKKGQFVGIQSIQRNSQQQIKNLSSSRFGSIKKNILSSNLQNQRMELNSKSSSSVEQSSKIARKVKGYEKYTDLQKQKRNKQFENQELVYQNERQSQNNEFRESRIVKNNSKCLKQSKYSKIRNQLHKNQSINDNENSCKENKSKIRQNNHRNSKLNFEMQSNQNKQQIYQNSSHSNKSSIDSQLSQKQMQQSRLKRASIEQTTVQKRIRQRKRSSNHQRYPINFSRLSKLNSLQIQIQNSHRQNSPNFVDQINDIQNSLQANENFVPIQKDWQDFTNQQIYIREPAQIIKKFAQENNFLSINSYSDSYAQILRDPQRSEVRFQIKGQQLLKKIIVKSIRQIHRPSQIRLFPQIFKQIQFNPTNQIPNLTNSAGSSYFSSNNNFNNNNSHCFKSKLVHVVNLMLRSNPMMISRIFEDKKNINPFGVYCIWLKNISGRFQPVFVNDQFAFQIIKIDKKPDQYKAIYSWLGNQNSIWFMLLEKAVAKILGGYQAINETNLAQLMNIIMGSPTVDIGYINPQKAIKAFDEKIFYNKMASLYTLRQNLSTEAGCTSIKQGSRVDRIIGFSYSKRNPSDSAVNIKVEEATVTMSMRQFLLSYGEVALLFFNNNYFLNQIQLTPTSNQLSVISCRLVCENSKNNCYLMFSCFPQKHSTKVTLYRQLNDNEAHIKQGMNPLSEQNRRYQYVGQICKTGNFFFQVQLNGGQYICLMESVFKQSKPFMSIFSEYPILIKESDCNQLGEKNKKSMIRKMKTKRKEYNQQSSFAYSQYDRSKTPKILIQKKINDNNEHKFYDEKMYKKYLQKMKKQKHENSTSEQLQIRVNKQYAYQLDNMADSDEGREKNQNDKQNMTVLSQSSMHSHTKSSRNKKIIVVQVQPKKQKRSRNSSQIMKQSLYQNSVTNAIQEVQEQKQADVVFNDEGDMSPTPIVNRNRIIDNYD